MVNYKTVYLEELQSINNSIKRHRLRESIKDLKYLLNDIDRTLKYYLRKDDVYEYLIENLQPFSPVVLIGSLITKDSRLINLMKVKRKLNNHSYYECIKIKPVLSGIQTVLSDYIVEEIMCLTVGDFQNYRVFSYDIIRIYKRLIELYIAASDKPLNSEMFMEVSMSYVDTYYITDSVDLLSTSTKYTVFSEDECDYIIYDAIVISIEKVLRRKLYEDDNIIELIILQIFKELGLDDKIVYEYFKYDTNDVFINDFVTIVSDLLVSGIGVLLMTILNDYFDDGNITQCDLISAVYNTLVFINRLVR